MIHRNLFIVAVLLLVASNSRAQQTNSVAAPAPEATSGEQSPPDFQPFSVGLEAGTTGLGGTIAWRFHDHLAVRAGMHYLNLSVSGSGDRAEDVDATDISLRLRLQSEPLTLDIHPWKRSSFRISAGVLFNQNEIGGDLSGTVEIDGTQYPNETLSLDSSWNSVAPYLGIGGNIYFDRARHWSLGGELGIAYTGSPTVSVSNPTGGIPASEVAKAQDDIEDVLQNFQIWPVAKFSFNYHF